jgi:drug/metabolite transporter superfamily protein YnfA
MPAGGALILSVWIAALQEFPAFAAWAMAARGGVFVSSFVLIAVFAHLRIHLSLGNEGNCNVTILAVF